MTHLLGCTEREDKMTKPTIPSLAPCKSSTAGQKPLKTLSFGDKSGERTHVANTGLTNAHANCDHDQGALLRETDPDVY